MALLTKKEFADICGLKTNRLSVEISRGNVFLSGELIDTKGDRNKAFLEKRQGRKTEEKPIITLIIPEKENKKSRVTQTEEPSEGQTYTESERQLKYLDTIKRQKEIEKLELDIQKKRGEVVPSELIKPVFLQHNQFIITEFKNAADEIIRNFSKKRSLTIEEVAEIKGETTQVINESINKAMLATIKSVESIVSEHSEKRGVGENA